MACSRDEINEVGAFYDTPRTFPALTLVGDRVLPAFASPVEGNGPGRIVALAADLRSATVRWDRTGATTVVEPWDVDRQETQP